MTLRHFRSHFDRVWSEKPDGFVARCPAHDDREPSLKVSAGEDGRILLYCHANCTTEEVVSALGLTMADLFDSSANGQRKGKSSARIEAIYDYPDETGQLLYQAVRYDPKDFKFRRPDGNEDWIWNLDGVRRVLYRLPEVMKSECILVLEGEKKVEAARAIGLVATCNPGGAGKWQPEYTKFLRGKRISVICDADAPGQAHGRDVARFLVGVAASVRLIEALPGVPHHGDLVNYLAPGGTRKSLLEFIKEAPELAVADVASWGSAKQEPSNASRAKQVVKIELVDSHIFLARPSPDDQPHLIEGLVPVAAHVMINGRPKSGKSHSLLQLAFDGACGATRHGTARHGCTRLARH
jgi:hypothetical protein